MIVIIFIHQRLVAKLRNTIQETVVQKTISLHN